MNFGHDFWLQPIPHRLLTFEVVALPDVSAPVASAARREQAVIGYVRTDTKSGRLVVRSICSDPHEEAEIKHYDDINSAAQWLANTGQRRPFVFRVQPVIHAPPTREELQVLVDEVKAAKRRARKKAATARATAKRAVYRAAKRLRENNAMMMEAYSG